MIAHMKVNIAYTEECTTSLLSVADAADYQKWEIEGEGKTSEGLGIQTSVAKKKKVFVTDRNMMYVRIAASGYKIRRHKHKGNSLTIISEIL